MQRRVQHRSTTNDLYASRQGDRWAVDVLLAGTLCLSLGLFLRGTRLSEAQAFSLICGGLGFLIAISIITLNFLQGPPFVGAALSVYLFSVRRRAKSVPLSAPGAN